MPGGRERRLRIDHHAHESKAMLTRLTLSLFAFMVFLSLMYTSFTQEDLPRITRPEEYWQAVASSDKVLMYFAQAACPSCKKIEPSIKKLAAERSDLVKVYKVDLDAIAKNVGMKGLLSFVSDLGVRGTPTLIVYVNGSEVARKEGLFGLGDQYAPLVEFVQAAVEGKLEAASQAGSVTAAGLTSLEAVASTTSPVTVAAVMAAAFALGLVAAVSPCSLPMIAVFASTAEESRRFKSYLTSLAAIIAVAFGAGSILAFLYVAGGLFPIINPLVLVIYASSAFIIAWGLLSLAGRDPMITVGGRARLLFPVLGLQCSLPFLVAMIALASKAPHLVFSATLMFAAGYGLPYALAATTGRTVMERLMDLAGSRRLQIIQGVVLIIVGAYLYWTTLGRLITL